MKIEIQVPEWARYTAFDSFAVFMAFQNKPERIVRSWKAKGRQCDVFNYTRQYYRGWTKTLKRIR